jgi:hypothetical protein
MKYMQNYLCRPKQRKLKENDMARQIVLSTRTFEKAGDATLFFRNMLKGYTVGERVSDVDAIDLTALLERHEEKSEKIGNGIKYFEVNLPPSEYPPYTQKCFWIVRADGSKIDFSVGHCLKRKPSD